ncbi:bifunctional 4-hydroxy-3-methylbut-2-enyl diphosphate reductase/30S ribosomal protein S1 [Youxingia wuxianensis]|uniref:bifunctional 4-hydroxy-3-methylbut-2-enyl diphosphate reductase/30S ribosomal protein S1 n=1 Tax=Youxingia wuxianensis TaxID=2763678 RepID=UPI0021CD006A|nr:bifunctional 4-hydroxy-3-methylbut-2-enyl diphosphate reductase/30S ribosomal protein S1 [Youxingia wuxianensis]
MITIAQTAGFCFGVQRAVDTAFAQAKKPEKTCTLGEIIHNPQIVESLQEQGIKTIETIEQAPPGSTVIIRSHGVPKKVYEQLAASGHKVIDATCPFVRKIHLTVEKYSKDHTILIAGDISHPEVEGIAGFCQGSYLVFPCADQLDSLINKQMLPEDCPYILVAQTTFSTVEWKKCVEKLKKVCTNLKIFDTICIATEKRQQEAMELAAKSDAMIVIGGKHSSNTAKLASLCGGLCDTFSIERPQEVYDLDLMGYTNIGVTAGASTPACIIKEVHKTMSEILKDQDELSFEEMLDQSFKTIYNREKVTAVVTGIAPNEISVDIGTKHAGYVPLSELTDDPNAKPEDIVKVGDELELLVIRVNDVEGTVMLSKKRLDAAAGFEKVMNAVDTQEVLEGVVVEVIKGGILVLTNGVKVFIPASQATLSRSDNLEDLLKKKVQFKILEVNRQRKRAVGSIKVILKEQRKELEEKFWADAQVGKVYTGVVKSLTSYGAFVNLGGVDGMVHISELSWNRIKHPSEVVNVGDTIEVYIKDIDADTKKISLGYKKSEDNPWEIMKKDYPAGAVVTVKIVSMTPFGAFAQIIPGVDGLIHISQISNERINKPSDVLAIGQEVQVKITEVDLEKKRVSLSMRALIEPEQKEENVAPVEEKDEVVYEAAPAQEGKTQEAPAEQTAEEEAPSSAQ